MAAEVTTAVVPGKRSFPLCPPRPVEPVAIRKEFPKLEKSKNVRRIRCTRSSISLARRENGDDEYIPPLPNAETLPPLPAAVPSVSTTELPAVPLRLDSAFGETFGIERPGSVKRMKVSNTPARLSIASEWTLPTVVEKQVLELPRRGIEVAPKAPLFDLEMFGNGRASANLTTSSNGTSVLASLSRFVSPPPSPSCVFDDYLELGESTSDRRVSRSTSGTEASLDDPIAPNEVHYTFSETPDTSPEIAEFAEPYVNVDDSPRHSIDPDAAWLFGQADQYRQKVAIANGETLPSIKSEPQLRLAGRDVSPPSYLEATRVQAEPAPIRSASTICLAKAVPYERARLVSWSSESSDGQSVHEEGHGGLTPANYRSPAVLSRRNSSDYFNLPLRPSATGSMLSLTPGTPPKRSSSRPLTPPADSHGGSANPFATPERQHSLRADVLSRHLIGLSTPPTTPEQRRISSSLRYVLPLLEDAVAGFPASMLHLESPVYNYIAPSPSSDKDAHLIVFREIFPSTSDFLRSTIYMHLLAIDYLDSLPSPVELGVMDNCIDPDVYPCPLLTTPRSRVGVPTDFPIRIGNVRMKLRDCLTRLLEATSGSSAAKRGKLLTSLLSMIRAMKNNNDTVPTPIVTMTSGAIVVAQDINNAPIDLLGPAIITTPTM